MTLFSVAPKAYDEGDQNRLREELRRTDQLNRKKGQDLEIAGDEKLILSSPDGTRWQITVANDGTVGSTAL